MADRPPLRAVDIDHDDGSDGLADRSQCSDCRSDCSMLLHCHSNYYAVGTEYYSVAQTSRNQSCTCMCRYWAFDPGNTYLKTGKMRQHLQLCPRKCVVMQVQQHVDGTWLPRVAVASCNTAGCRGT